ncbi:MAG: hypothetical protein U1E65_08540 [Myxococcota bacterium]
MVDPIEEPPLTKLVERKLRPAIEGRYGAFRWIRQLVAAPGVVLAEGTDQRGDPVLLQIVRTRLVADEAERLRRLHLERVIAARTAGLLEEGVIAHGVEVEPDGARALYWVLPWSERYLELARPERPDLGLIVRAGMVLATRLVSRHVRGRTEPLLSEKLLLLGDVRDGALLVGLPVFVPPEWLAEDMAAPALAPEERVRVQLEPSGDLWRLGRALRSLMEQGRIIHAPLEKLVASLELSDRAQRTPRASQVLAELESIAADLDGSTRAGPTALFSAMDPSQLSALLLDATEEPEGGAPSSSAAEPSFESLSLLYAPLTLDTMLDSHVRLLEADAAPKPKLEGPRKPAIEIDARHWTPNDPEVHLFEPDARPTDPDQLEPAEVPLRAAAMGEPLASDDGWFEAPVEAPQARRGFAVRGPTFAFWMIVVSVLAFGIGVGLGVFFPR